MIPTAINENRPLLFIEIFELEDTVGAQFRCATYLTRC
jgi:hypothetical protein